MPSCSTVTVIAGYGPRSPFTLARPPVTRAEHRRALDALQESFNNAPRTRFGLMGEGLTSDPDAKPCEFRSRALKLNDEDDHHAVVYSFTKWP